MTAWEEFKKGKRRKFDVQEFERNLEDNLFKLHNTLQNKTYCHSSYEEFYVNDPKRRHIHKATVNDRIVHHLVYKYLYALFDKNFIYDSYSCRNKKGTHKAVKRLFRFTRKVSRNYASSCWVLHLDVKKFFSSVDHEILFSLLQKKIQDKNILRLLSEIINSFATEKEKGIPLGNVTSQVFANIYLNELDQYVKHCLKIKYYIRYADDFVIISRNKAFLYQCIDTSKQFLNKKLELKLHLNKISIRKLGWGIDFLGYIVLPYYILPRTKNKKRIIAKLQEKNGSENFNSVLQSYLGYLIHANAYEFIKDLNFLVGK